MNISLGFPIDHDNDNNNIKLKHVVANWGHHNVNNRNVKDNMYMYCVKIKGVWFKNDTKNRLLDFCQAKNSPGPFSYFVFLNCSSHIVSVHFLVTCSIIKPRYLMECLP